MRTLSRYLAPVGLAVGLFAGVNGPRAEAPWETVLTSPIVVKTRPKEGTGIKEIWAEGYINAPVQDIQDTLMDPDRFPKFMPNVKHAQKVSRRPDATGAEYVYTRLSLPVVSDRDYVVKVLMTKQVAADGSGEFANEWVAVKGWVPERRGAVRLYHNEGSWHVVPKGPNRSYAIYKFMVDPGGSVPGFIANMGNKQGVTETYKAVEQEAQRRAKERKDKPAAQAPAPNEAPLPAPPAQAPAAPPAAPPGASDGATRPEKPTGGLLQMSEGRRAA